MAGLRRLRLSFGEATRKLQLPKAPLVGAFERWHFAWLLAATGPADPLLPLASSSAADAVLVAELEGAGATPAAAAGVVAALGRDAAREAEAMRRRQPEEQAEADCVELAPAEGGLVHIACPAAGGGLKLGAEYLAKLRAMHARVRAFDAAAAGGEEEEQEEEQQEEERLFRTDLVRLLLRYKALGVRRQPSNSPPPPAAPAGALAGAPAPRPGPHPLARQGSGFQAALGGAAHAVLREGFGCALECFASPLNARSAPFCSGFADTDAAFGSVGRTLASRPA